MNIEYLGEQMTKISKFPLGISDLIQIRCQNCGTEVKPLEYCPECGTFVVDNLDVLWYYVVIMISPFIGLFAGFYYVIKHRVWGWHLVGISMGAWITMVVLGSIFIPLL
jgi:hypothetical protein